MEDDAFDLLLRGVILALTAAIVVVLVILYGSGL
jgi:hypothetical protein